MKTVALYSIKGGVGKTSAAVSLAWLAAQSGKRTLVWDLDPQGAATYLFRVRAKVKGGGADLLSGRTDLAKAVKGTDHERLDLLPADFSYRNLDLELDSVKGSTRRIAKVLEPIAGDYDLVVLDCPPSISLVSVNVMRAADLVWVPIVPSVLSVRTLEQLQGFLEDAPGKGPKVRAFFSMVDRRRKLHRDVVASLPGESKAVVAIEIPAASIVEQMGERRAPLPAYAPSTPAARAYQQLWTETERLLS